MDGSRVSTAQLARRAGKSQAAVRYHLRSGALGFERFGPRGWYSVSAADAEAFIVKSRKCGDAAGVAAGGNEDDLTAA
jgi:hypothetical protein